MAQLWQPQRSDALGVRGGAAAPSGLGQRLQRVRVRLDQEQQRRARRQLDLQEKAQELTPTGRLFVLAPRGAISQDGNQVTE